MGGAIDFSGFELIDAPTAAPRRPREEQRAASAKWRAEHHRPAAPSMAADLKHARELCAKRQYRESLRICRLHAAKHRATGSSSAYLQLVDEICMYSAATGDVIGFDDGRVLQVLPSSPTASWPGPPAPGTPPAKRAAAAPRPADATFGSVAEALEAAADGDVVQLLPGTHEVSQASLLVAKRVLVEGTGASPQHVVLDHRANHPALVVTRSCILRNFAVDAVSFCEAVAVEGDSQALKPILQDLVISCSGDDGLAVAGKAQPLLHDCAVQARRCALKLHGSSSTTLWKCSVSGGQHGVAAFGGAQVFLEGCRVEDCGLDGLVGMGRASISLTNTVVCGCRGPGLDLSDDSSAVLKHAEVRDCVGGVWLWHRAACEAVGCHIAGGSSYAVLLDEEAYARGSSCTIDGHVHDSSERPLPGGRRRHAPPPEEAPLRCAAPWGPERAGGSGGGGSGAPAGAAPASPLSTSSADTFGAADALAVMTVGGGSGVAGGKQPLAQPGLLPASAAAAAALFPPEQGAFAEEEDRLF